MAEQGLRPGILSPVPVLEKNLPTASQWPLRPDPVPWVTERKRRAPTAIIAHASISVNKYFQRWGPQKNQWEEYQKTLQLKLRWQLFSSSIDISILITTTESEWFVYQEPCRSGNQSSRGDCGRSALSNWHAGSMGANRCSISGPSGVQEKACLRKYRLAHLNVRN